jgi:hypothetical protein
MVPNLKTVLTNLMPLACELGSTAPEALWVAVQGGPCTLNPLQATLGKPVVAEKKTGCAVNKCQKVTKYCSWSYQPFKVIMLFSKVYS